MTEQEIDRIYSGGMLAGDGLEVVTTYGTFLCGQFDQHDQHLVY